MSHSFERDPEFGAFANAASPPKAVAGPPAGPIVAGKNSDVYDAHTYHTKVPPGGITPLIEHFTRPGDVVLDPFCGSGMTGVAALEAGRAAMLCDLSPAATFIAKHLTAPADPARYRSAAAELIRSARAIAGDLYVTPCRECGKPAELSHMVWSAVLACPACAGEFVLWDAARSIGPTVRQSKILAAFPCPRCGERIAKRGLRRTGRVPVEVGYRCCARLSRDRTAAPLAQDAEVPALAALRLEQSPLWRPADAFGDGCNTRQARNHGIERVDQAYPPRALLALAALWDGARRHPDPEIAGSLQFTLTSLYQRVTWFSEFRFWGGSGNLAHYNVPHVVNEQNVFLAFERKAATIARYYASAPRLDRRVRISTQSATDLAQIADGSIDYVFTDPPFGANINYSEMNLLWESWLRRRTDPADEAIVSRAQGKGMQHYEDLLTAAFGEIARVLKPGAWASIVFHNSSARVWEALRNALGRAGLSIEGTQTFDKRHGTFKQFVSPNAVGYDLVMHCRAAGPARPAAPPQTARAFIEGALSRASSMYRVDYLHVARAAEFDYRKLYAEWLGSRVAGRVIEHDFAAFRAICDEVRPNIRRGTPVSRKISGLAELSGKASKKTRSSG